jgi:hypothetical protein
MDMQFYGANTIVLSSKSNRVVIDDNLTALGAKGVGKDGDICLFTAAHGSVAGKPKIVIDMPGEYEVSNVSVFGMQARAHMDEAGKESATMYKITWGEVRVLVTGHVAGRRPQKHEHGAKRAGGQIPVQAVRSD